MDFGKVDMNDPALFESLGFKCGLEIHQQVATERKLFCHCPVGLTKRRHDAEILRHMRPTLSELGEYDGTALMEFKTKKEVIYRLYRDRTCTYEMDDTPPFLVNQQAVDYAIQIALLFNCKIVDEIHVIRKQYLDGSIPTGFQRTMIIGVDGWVPYKGRKITITQVNLEEEACREISDIGHLITFATDRLSTPLVEIITGADMRNPIEAEEVCRLLGNSMKITGLVRRGIGTVRQDVNVSVTGGKRVEIKGVYKVGNIRALTAYEALRQNGLLELQEKFNRQFPIPASISYKENNLTAIFSGTGNIIGRRLESDQPLKVVALLLPGLAEYITTPLQPNWDFGSELMGRIRVIACIDSKPNLFFYSRRRQYDIPDRKWQDCQTSLGWEEKDDIVLICGPSADVTTAINEIRIRIAELAQGVINETRQDMKDGTTDFERILPGPDRMYPDTDHPPVRISEERVTANRGKIGEPLWEKQTRWAKMGLHQEQINALSLSPFVGVFEQLAAEMPDKAPRAAHLCTALMVALRRQGFVSRRPGNSEVLNIFRTTLENDLPYRQVKILLRAEDSGEKQVSADNGKLTSDAFEKVWRYAEKAFSGRTTENHRNKLRRFVVGQLLGQFPADLREILSRVDSQLSKAK